jgi:hypothetical protein
MSKLTRILDAAAQGDTSAAGKLLPLVYDELRQLAARKMAAESGTQTPQPTALVHGAWLRLGGDQQPTWDSRTYFFCAAAEAMRRILIDRARSQQARRHGGGQQRLVDEVEIAAPMKEDELLAVNESPGPRQPARVAAGRIGEAALLRRHGPEGSRPGPGHFRTDSGVVVGLCAPRGWRGSEG